MEVAGLEGCDILKASSFLDCHSSLGTFLLRELQQSGDGKERQLQVVAYPCCQAGLCLLFSPTLPFTSCREKVPERRKHRELEGEANPLWPGIE